MKVGESMWNYNKPISQRSRAEIELQEAFGYMRELEEKLKKLEAVVDSLYFKAQISHSLLVIEKVSEDALKALNLLGTEGGP